SNCNLGLWLFLGIASSIVFEEAISHIIFYVNVLMKLCTSWHIQFLAYLSVPTNIWNNPIHSFNKFQYISIYV
ncbi:MAG: hypothetical protein SWH54_01385, partial [Thermodesulfobacteriota bacterium]|nr:hypothetical protein [Thermodesulfobacteriota bacterium]